MQHAEGLFEGDSRRVRLSSDLAGIAVLRDGSVVFADTGNLVIRRHFPYLGGR